MTFTGASSHTHIAILTPIGLFICLSAYFHLTSIDPSMASVLPSVLRSDVPCHLVTCPTRHRTLIPDESFLAVAAAAVSHPTRSNIPTFVAPAPAVFGFDDDIDAFCSTRPSTNTGWQGGYGHARNCVESNLNILSLYGKRVPYNSCRNVRGWGFDVCRPVWRTLQAACDVPPARCRSRSSSGSCARRWVSFLGSCRRPSSLPMRRASSTRAR